MFWPLSKWALARAQMLSMFREIVQTLLSNLTIYMTCTITGQTKCHFLRRGEGISGGSQGCLEVGSQPGLGGRLE